MRLPARMLATVIGIPGQQGFDIVMERRRHHTMERVRTLIDPLRALAGAAILTAAVAAALLPVAAGAQEVDTAPVPATVNINSADAATLAETLSGVGSSRAEAIVRYRELYGPFESIEELAEVSGVGNATLERNRGRITLE